MAARRASIKDVALRAGVDPKTVSNVLHQRPVVAPATRERVEQAIEDLGYRANLVGRRLREGRTGILLLAVPEMTSPYFAALATKIIAEAQRHEHLVVIEETQSDPDREEAVLKGSKLHFADGIMLATAALDPELVQKYATRTPLVLIGERVPDPLLNHVVIDNVQSAREATQHLLDQGVRSPLFLGAPTRPYGPGALRSKGFIESLHAAGLPIDDDQLVPAAFSRAEGAAAINRVIAGGTEFDAIVAAVDVLALGAMHALRQHGLSVPDDVLVLGWDNTEDGAYANPTLTSVAPDIDAVARALVTNLLARIDAPTSTDLESQVISHQLIIRESSIRPSHAG
ncbi:LacI family DNA-binding transcriptional regulator [Propionibacteriaceae bacterium Y1700]|uniref:LacI family DNA-binding transcriptional regulator n=1 Tax=Microlunatus sp. Y1700 TaxID=3418487 RepID=UPI003DA6D3EA